MFASLDFKLPQQIYALIALPIVCELVFVGTLVAWNQGIEEGKYKESLGRNVLAHVRRLTQTIVSAAKSALILQVQKDTAMVDSFDRSVQRAQEELDALQDLLQGNPKYGSMIKAVRSKWELPFAELKEIKRLLATGDSDAGIERLEQLGPVLEQMNQEGDKIVAPFMRLTEAGERDQARARQGLIAILFCLLGGSVLLAFALVRFFSSNTVRRLQVLMENTDRLEKGQDLHAAVSGKDEIAELDRVFHHMAKSINEASDQLRLSEAQTRVVIESMPIGVLTLDREKRIQSANPTAEKMFVSETLANGDTFDTLFLAAKEDPLQKKNKSQEITARKSTGEEFPAEISLTDLHGPKFEGLLLNIIDISERKRLEKLKQDFLAMVSHDLRSPLTAMKLSYDLMEMGSFGELPPRMLKKVKADNQNCGRLISMINDLLDVEKMEAGCFDVVLEATNYHAVVDKTMAAVENLAEKAGLVMETQDENITFIADPDRIIQTLINLVSNAIKFSPAGSKVSITASRESDWIIFRVSDQGRGIPEEKRLAIFDKFRQVEANDARKKGGTGLGLAICKGIVESHGGVIGVDSEEGKGSTFWFKLPDQLGDQSI